MDRVVHFVSFLLLLFFHPPTGCQLVFEILSVFDSSHPARPVVMEFNMSLTARQLYWIRYLRRKDVAASVLSPQKKPTK